MERPLWESINSNSDFQDRTKVLNKIKFSILKDQNVVNVFTSGDVKEAINDFKMGKNAGFDGVNAEHFKYADNIVCMYYVCI